MGSWLPPTSQDGVTAAPRVDRGQRRGQRASFFCLFGDKTDLVILPCSTEHLAEDMAILVSDPGQVWRRDWAFKGMLRSEGPAWPGVPGQWMEPSQSSSHGLRGRGGRAATPTFPPCRHLSPQTVCWPPCPGHKAPLFSWVVLHLGPVTWEVGVQAETGGSRGARQGNEQQPEACGPPRRVAQGQPQCPPLCTRPPGYVRGQGVSARSGLEAKASRARWLQGLLSVCDLPSFEVGVSSCGRPLRWGPKRRGPCPGWAALGCSPQLSPVPRGFCRRSPQSGEVAAQHMDSQTDPYVTRPPGGVGPPS